MMPKKVHLSSIEDKDPEKCIAATGSGPKLKTTPSQRSSDTTSSSPESSGTNGDVKRNGKSRRRKKRSSNPDSGTEEVVRGQSVEPGTGHKGDPAASLAGLQSECASVWMERSSYERAESLYHSWLACNSNGTGTKSRPPPAQGKTTPPTVTQSCQHGEHVACHHLVNDVWVNKHNFDQAEDHFLKSVQPSVPNSLNLQRPPVTPDSPDEGYQSRTPTPATPLVQQQPALTAAARPSVNGLPGFPLEILQDVWLDKPRYDRAEAAFYQNLYGSNSSKRPGATSNSRSGDRPQRLLEEEEEEEEEAMSVEEKPATPQGKAEIFHALHPIQEEEEPAEVSDKEDPSGPGTAYFLHPDSERVWMDRRQFDVAESRFHDRGGKAAGKKGRRSAGVAATQIGVKSTMTSVQFLAQEKIWFEKPKYDEAERRFYENQNRSSQLKQDVGPNSSILQDIARARENIQKSLAGNTNTTCSAADQELVTRIKNLELENHNLYKVMGDLRSSLSKLESRVAVLEKSPAAASSTVALTNGTSVQQKTTTPAKPVAADDDDDDDDMDLFGSDEEDDEEAEKLREQRVKEYAAKKSKKPAIIAKSSILLDVKPWDDETDMKQLETNVRSVQMDGLLWGSSKLVPVGYGIQKLQINCVVEDDKVGTDILEEEIVKFEDYVQSVDVAAFNKI